MPSDPQWRAKIEALELAGLEYVHRSRLDEMKSALKTPMKVQLPSPAFQANVTPMPPSATSVAAVSRTSAEVAIDPLRIAELKVLAGEVAGCRKCAALCDSRTQTVFSDGDPHAELCFIGEAPGADEDASGIPFVGRAGQLLTKIIEACKLTREQVYICNVLKCRPPDNRNPLPDEIKNCRPYLDRQLALVKPKMLVALGKFAAAHLLQQPPESVPITKIRGQIRQYNGIPFMITLHPAYLLRNPSAKKDVWEDMKTVMRMLGKPVD